MVTAGGGKSSKAKETVKIEFYREKTERKNPRSPLIEFVIQELSKEAIEALSNYLGQLLLSYQTAEYGTNAVIQHFRDPDIVTQPLAELNVKGFDVVRLLSKNTVNEEVVQTASAARFQLEYKEEGGKSWVRVRRLDAILNYSKLRRLFGRRTKPVFMTYKLDLFVPKQDGDKFVGVDRILSHKFKVKEPYTEVYKETDELKKFDGFNIESSTTNPSPWAELPDRPIGYLKEFGSIYDSGWLGVNAQVTEGNGFKF